MPRWIPLVASHRVHSIGSPGRGQDSPSRSRDQEDSPVLSNGVFFSWSLISLFTLAAGKLRMISAAHPRQVSILIHVFVQTSFQIPFYVPALVLLSLLLSICTTLTHSMSLCKLPKIPSGTRQGTDNIFIAGQRIGKNSVKNCMGLHCVC